MNIIINGKNINTKCSTIYDLKEQKFKNINNLVTIYNGFQTEKNYDLHESDNICFIEKGKMPHKDELESLMSARHTPHVFEKLKKARVAIAGLGGLGSNIAISLARCGVGYLHLIDFDIVEPSNLNRQQYKISHIGKYKTDSLKEEINEINPYLNIKIDTERVTEDNFKSLFIEDEIICEAFDNPQAKSMILNSMIETYPEKKLICSSGMAGYFTSNSIVTKKLSENVYICGDLVNSAKVGQGLMAPRVSICAGHEANMVLRLILGINEV